MKGSRSVVAALLIAFLGLAAPITVSAAESGGAAGARRSEDAVCTKCHDESEAKPILAIYQTPHGVAGDGRTPSCQSCHGESKNHVAGSGESNGPLPVPDMVFGRKHTTAGYVPNDPQAQAETCLTCHKSSLRMHWPGSQHQVNDVVCSSCHTVHIAKDPVLVKIEQPEV